MCDKMYFERGGGKMRVFHSLNFKLDSPYAIALGCFDGVHIGHAAVIREAKQIALGAGVGCAVFTFEAPPKNYFSPNSAPLLCSLEDKLAHLESLGADICVCLPLSEEIFNTDALSFIRDILFDKMCASAIVCGYNYTFGKGGAGNLRLLRKICAKEGVGLSVLPEQRLGKAELCSSQIRKALAEGDMERASAMLGRSFSLSARVVDGQHLARTLGFPTVNIIPEPSLMLPRRGVYVSKIKISDTEKYGITNIGLRPTVGTELECAETHIFDFDGNLYGQKITVELLSFLREEKKFDSVAEMARQIHEDIEGVRFLLAQK